MVNRKITITEFNTIRNEWMQQYYQLLVGKEPSTLKNERGFEKHHIIPRCFGGSNDKSNIVKLTTYEHILAHYYLALGTENIHMFTAINLMMGKSFKKLSDLERVKIEELEHWSVIREQCRQKHYSDEGRATISQKAKERWQRFKKSGRIDEVRANISKTTSEGIANSKKAQIRTRVNLGCKKYWNPETGEARNWYPGMPPFESPWIPGRPKMTESAKQKLKETLARCKKHFYHNDELKINTTFNENDTIPAGWIRGKKVEYDVTTKIYKRTIKEQRLQELLNS